MTRAREIHNALTGEHLTFLKTGSETGGELLQVEVRLDPRGKVPLHLHARQDERVEVLSGAVAIRVGGQERTLGVGDKTDVPRRRLHVISNVGQGESRLLVEVRPARRMEATMRGLFRVMGLFRWFARRRTPRRAEPT